MKQTNLEDLTLESAEDQIIAVLGTPYGHNIIAIILQQVEDKFGEHEAEKLWHEYQ